MPSDVRLLTWPLLLKAERAGVSLECGAVWGTGDLHLCESLHDVPPEVVRQGPCGGPAHLGTGRSAPGPLFLAQLEQASHVRW